MANILVVDDEIEVLNVVEQTLVRNGHSILKAISGNQALQLFEKAQIPIDLLLADVVMPGMSGPMLVDRLLSVQPSLPVLFMSGYDERQVVQRYVVKEGFALLTKPFELQTLIRRVSDMLPVAPISKAHTA